MTGGTCIISYSTTRWPVLPDVALQSLLVTSLLKLKLVDRFYVYFKWFMRHPVLKWWIQQVYDGAWMEKGVLVIGDAKNVWEWDGGDCQPFQ